jgi:hypothetical protein
MVLGTVLFLKADELLHDARALACSSGGSDLVERSEMEEEGRARKQVVKKHVIVKRRKLLKQGNNDLLGRVQQTHRLVLCSKGFSPTTLRVRDAQWPAVVDVPEPVKEEAITGEYPYPKPTRDGLALDNSSFS